MSDAEDVLMAAKYAPVASGLSLVAVSAFDPEEFLQVASDGDVVSIALVVVAFFLSLILCYIA